MEMRLRRPGEAFTSQGRSTSGAKATPRLPGRRIELGYLAFGDRISLQVIKREDRDRCTGMPSTTLTMTPIYRLGLSGRDKADCAAEAATFKLLGRAAHDLILPRPGVTYLHVVEIKPQSMLGVSLLSCPYGWLTRLVEITHGAHQPKRGHKRDRYGRSD